MSKKGHTITELARIGDFAVVEIVESSGHSIVQLHFMNMSLRMCKKQFENFTIMLNEAMLKLANNDAYFADMKKLFSLAGDTELDVPGKENSKEKLN